MSTDKSPQPARELPEDEAERLVYETMRQGARFVPQSPEEVARAEAEIDEAAVELPPGLRDPLAVLNRPAPPASAKQPPQPAEPAPALTSPAPGARKQENPMRSTRLRKMIAWLVVVGTFGTVATVAGYQYVTWRSQSAAVRDRDAVVRAKVEELQRVRDEQAAALTHAENQLASALVEEATVRERAWAERERARKELAEKDFVVKVTGPTHVQPGALNKWQIETLRHGAIARPKQLDVVVTDAKDVELFRQTHDKPVGVATLELTPAFWEKVKPGTDLFLNVVSRSEEGRTSKLADRLPLARPVYVTHLVTDKPLYKPGETIRFRSLTLDRSTLLPPAHELHLSFRLRNPADAVVQLDVGNGRLISGLKLVIGPDKKPLRGIGVGEYQLPEEAPGGEYKLDLFERSPESGQEVLLETRKFIVNSYVPDTFEKKLEFDGKSYGPGDVVQARIEVSRTAGGPMKDAKAHVVAAVDGKTFHEQKDAAFTLTTDANGPKTVLDVRFKLPADIFEKPQTPSATLSVNIQDGSDAEPIVRPIPLVTKTLKVEFFPEGGEMIEGVSGRVYFMARTPIGKPADLKGTITDGTNTLAEVATLTDSENPGVNRGHGIFALKPEPGKKYFLKLTSPTGITEPTPSGFPLPAAKADGVALTALDAVTEKGAPIRVRLHVPTGPKTLHVGAYVRERLVAQEKLVLPANASAEVALKSAEAAGGVTRVTVFEEVKGDGGAVLVPRAERLVFRAAGEHLVLRANADKPRYSPSDKVKLDLSALTEKGQPTPAVLMVGVVNRSVITMADNKTDRLQSTHFLLSGEVRNSVELEHADFLLTDHPKAGVALDLLLGTQGWRRFAEQDVAPANPADRPDVDKMLLAHGQRSTVPLELFKLEEQRVSAEFAPQMEAARLRALAVADAWVSVQPTQIEKLKSARESLSGAATERSEAAAALGSFEARVGMYRDRFLGTLVGVLIAVGLFCFIRVGLTATAVRPEGYGRSLVAAVCSVLVCGFAVVLLSQSQRTRIIGAMKAGASNNRSAELIPEETRLTSQDAPLQPLDAINGDTGVRVWNGPPPRLSVLRSTTERPGMGLGGDPRNSNELYSFFARRSGSTDDVTRLWLESSEFSGRSGATRERFRGWSASGEIREYAAGRKATSLAAAADALRATALRGHSFVTTTNGLFGSRSRSINANGYVRGTNANGRFVAPFAVGAVMFDPIGQPDWDEIDTAAFSPDGRGLALRRFAGFPSLLPFVVRQYAHQRDPALGEVRSDFTETVYWHPVLVLPESGKATVEFQLSDDIARYQVLVAGHTLDGRIGAITQTIEARKPFSIDPKLPLEISNTDTVEMPIRVTNDSDVRRNVSFKSTLSGFKSQGPLQDAIDLAPNAKGRKLLRLTPDKLDGDLSVLLEGTSVPAAQKDSILRTVRVVPDGFPGVGSVSDMIEGRARGAVTLPKDMLPGSLKVRLEVYPTSMADLAKGLEGLMREPSGCFEQTSTSNYPNAMILEFMNLTNQTNPLAAAKAKDFLARGYGRLTSFECPDTPTRAKQGYEWFGAADRPHLALTAYGLMQFKDMSRVHPVDPQMIKRTQSFLLSWRDGKGSFNQPADSHSFGSAPKHIVDAYVVWALVESDPEDTERLDLRTEIAALKSEAANEKSVGGKDPYFVALVANVLILRGDRETAHRLLDRLQEKHTKAGAVTGATTSITKSGGRDLEIETTALALLGWLRANDPKYGTAVKAATKWISQQRGGYGGFGSTQSTILALKALVLFAKKTAHPAEAGEIRVTLGGQVIGSRRFTPQDVEVIGLDIPNPEAAFKPGERNEVEIVTDAKQAYPFALSYTFTSLTPVSAEKCAVQIATKLAKAEASEGETVPLSVTLENKQDKGHGMSVAIIGIPAGMKVPTDMKQLTDLRENKKIAYFEIRGRELVLYWRELAPKQKIELTVDLVCDVPGQYRGPASRAYLYYDADHKHWVEPLAVKINAMENAAAP